MEKRIAAPVVLAEHGGGWGGGDTKELVKRENVSAVLCLFLQNLPIYSAVLFNETAVN